MPVYKFNYEFYTQNRGSIEIEAASLAAAMEQAQALDLDDVDFDIDYETTTNTRLFSVDLDGEEEARVYVPKACWAWSWIDLDLTEQWARASDPLPDSAAAAEFDKIVHSHFMSLPPELSDAARAEVQASDLRSGTPPAMGNFFPIRK